MMLEEKLCLKERDRVDGGGAGFCGRERVYIVPKQSPAMWE